MDGLFGGIFFLLFALLWTIGSVLPFVAIGFIIYRLTNAGRAKRASNSQVATPFLSAQPKYRCEHCDSTVETSSTCPNCGAPVEASLP